MFSPFKQIKRYVILKASWTRRRMGSHGVLDSEVFETPRVRLMCRVRSCCLCDSVAFKNMFYVLYVLIFHLFRLERRCDVNQFGSFPNFMVLQREIQFRMKTHRKVCFLLKTLDEEDWGVFYIWLNAFRVLFFVSVLIFLISVCQG